MPQVTRTVARGTIPLIHEKAGMFSLTPEPPEREERLGVEPSPLANDLSVVPMQ